jgi:predicted Zn-dependent protease
MAAHHLAKLAMDRGEQDKAREFLHQALIFDPNDAFALNMLAKLYLDRGEDPEIAENLARQSVHLRPDIPSMWIEVARALETRGKTDEARTAQLRSRARH